MAWSHIYPYSVGPYPLFVHFVTFITPQVVCTLFALLDVLYFRYPSLRRWRFESPKPTDIDFLLRCAEDNLVANLGVSIVLELYLWLFPDSLSEIPTEGPALLTLVGEILALMVVWEFIVWPAHRAQHSPWWYKRFHKRHHEGYICAHSTMAGNPIDEVISSNAILAPFYILKQLWHMHPLSLYCYLVYFVSFGVATHSGWALPGCDFHYQHHKRLHGNYGGTGRWLDKVMGTHLNRDETSH